MSDDQLEAAAGGAAIPVLLQDEGAIIPIETPLDEAIIPFDLEEKKQDGIQLANDPGLGDKIIAPID